MEYMAAQMDRQIEGAQHAGVFAADFGGAHPGGLLEGGASGSKNGGRRTPTRYESRSGREGLRTQRKTKMRAGNGSKQTMTAS